MFSVRFHNPEERRKAMMKSMVRKVGNGLIIWVVFLAFCTTPAFAQDKVRIGVLLPFSGPLAYEGNEVFKGFEVARVEQNEKGGLLGKQIEFLKGDAVDPKAAVSEAERLISVEKVSVILGTFSSPRSYAASTIAEKNKVVYWETGSVGDDITKRGYKYIFRICPNAEDLAKAASYFGVVVAPRMLKIAAKDLKVAVIGENSLYGTSVSKTAKGMVEAEGAQLVAYEFYDANTKDLSSLILRLKAKKPDVLIPTCYVNDAILLSRQSKQMDFNVKVFVGTGVGHNTKALADAIGDDVNGILCSGWPSTTLNKKFAWGLDAFMKTYEKVWKEPIGSPHPFGNYTGAWVLWDTIKRAKSMDAEAIRKAAETTDIPKGKTPIGWGVKFVPPEQINAGQNMRALWFVEQWKDRKLHCAWPDDAKEAGYQVILPYPTWEERKKK
jgi:branched-chain amino acid transport system substrate-binding protein